MRNQLILLYFYTAFITPQLLLGPWCPIKKEENNPLDLDLVLDLHRFPEPLIAGRPSIAAVLVAWVATTWPRIAESLFAAWLAMPLAIGLILVVQLIGILTGAPPNGHPRPLLFIWVLLSRQRIFIIPLQTDLHLQSHPSCPLLLKFATTGLSLPQPNDALPHYLHRMRFLLIRDLLPLINRLAGILISNDIAPHTSTLEVISVKTSLPPIVSLVIARLHPRPSPSKVGLIRCTHLLHTLTDCPPFIPLLLFQAYVQPPSLFD